MGLTWTLQGTAEEKVWQSTTSPRAGSSRQSALQQGSRELQAATQQVQVRNFAHKSDAAGLAVPEFVSVGAGLVNLGE